MTAEVVERGDGHASMASGSAIAENPNLSVSREYFKHYGDDDYGYAPPAGSNSPTYEALQQARIPQDVIEQAVTHLEQGSGLPQHELDAMDQRHMPEAEQELRNLWGAQFDDNLASIKRYLNDLPAGMVFMHARDASGRALANRPEVLVALLEGARRPAPKFDGDIDAQIREVEQFMKSRRREYDRSPSIQSHYRALLSLKHGVPE